MENKYEMLKNTIYQLYSKEGRTKSYIARLLELNRKTLIMYINDIWKLPKAEPHRYMNPSTEKFYNKNKQLIKSRLDNDISLVDIAKELHCSKETLRTIFYYDKVLEKAKNDYVARIHKKHKEAVNKMINDSSNNYDFEEFENETWKQILGYDDYYVSNYGRVKHYIKTYDKYILLTNDYNKHNGRYYVTIHDKTLQVARIVAHAFCDGYSEERNTINHIDGNKTNNNANNLEWVSQSENNKHAYEVLHRKKVRVGVKNRKYKHFIYKGTYEFHTVSAFARFIDKSETQARRWLDEADKHDIKIIE